MVGEDSYNILIVDGDSTSRGRLKQVALALFNIRKIFACSSLSKALIKADFRERIDIVIVSHQFGEEKITRFIEQAKKTKRGKNWAYMAVLKSAEQKHEVIARGVMDGIDGFLFEPYSAENMREMAEITARVKLRNEQRRQHAAVTMFAREIADHLDAVSFYRSMGREPTLALRKLRDACQALPKFKEECFDVYVEAVTELFEKRHPPAAKTYRGVSQRVKEKLEAQALDELDKKYRR